MRLPLQAEPATLQPGAARDLYSTTVVKMLYDGLTRLDGEGNPKLSLATSVDVSGSTYTFTLGKTAWSDGTPLTADDFVRSWRELFESKSEMAYLLFPIKGARELWNGEAAEFGVRAEGKNRLVVELEASTPLFLHLCALPCAMPVKGELTNGPFRLESWQPSDRLTLVKSDTYWDRDAVKLAGLDLLIIPDEMTALYLFEEGELDWVGSPLSTLPSDVIASQSDFDRFSLAATSWYVCNREIAPFNNAKVRRALALAIDRELLCQHVIPTHPEPATGPIPLCMGVANRPYFADGAIADAKGLLKQALREEGWDRLPRITISYGDSEQGHAVAQAVADQWREALGIQVDLRRMEIKSYLESVERGSFQVASKNWIADTGDPMEFLERFPDLGESYAALLELARREEDPEKRREFLIGAESIFVDEMPAIPIFHNKFCYGAAAGVEGVVLPPAGAPDFKWACR
jgi:oligopeptide transport system substrate-binding protein